jgi:uncharacterized protein (TIRG00374 family)
MTKKRIVFAAKLIISIAAFAVIFSQLNLKSIAAAISSAKISLLVLAFLLSLVQPALNALKIKLLLPGSKVEYHYVLFANFALNFFRLTIPSDAGAELGRGYYLSKRTGSPAAAFSAIVLDRYFGFCSQVFVVSVVSLVFGFADNAAFWRQVGLFAAAVLLFAVVMPILFYRIPVIKRSARKGFVRITSAIAQLSESLHVFRTMPLRLVLAGAMSVISLCLALLMIVTLSAAFHEPLHFREASLIMFLSSIACFLPSFAGLGFVEGIFAGMFYYFSIHQEIGFTVSITLRFFSIALALPGVFFFIAEDRLLKKTAKEVKKHSKG